MEEQEFNLEETVQKLVEALTALTEKIDEMDSRINELDSVLYDGLIGPANDQISQNEYDNALSDFRTKYSEKLGPLEGHIKAIEGDDFDVFKNAFDNYNDNDYDMSPDEYVDKLTASLSEQIEKVKAAFAEKAGVDEKDVNVEVNGDGEVEVEVDSDEALSDGNCKEKKDIETNEPEKEDDTGETLEDFEDSLKKEAEKDKGKSWIRG